MSIIENVNLLSSHIDDELPYVKDEDDDENYINYKNANINYWNNLKNFDEKLKIIMKNNFGYDNFRLNQKGIINAVILGNDVFVNMPTAGGKSLTYQLPALYENKGVYIIIMPLKSLIEDQYNKLLNLGIKCFYIKSSDKISNLLIKNTFEDILNGIDSFNILFLTPEKLEKSNMVKDYIQIFYNRGILRRIIVDEAHCVSNWGHDFRKDYLNIKNIKKLCPKVPMMALTATATKLVRINVIKELGMSKDTIYFRNSYNRTNLYYKIINKSKNVNKDIFNLINNNFKNKAGIIYCITIKDCNKIYKYLKDLGLSVGEYNTGVNEKDRSLNQKKWMEDDIKIIIATIAFGMGIDKPDVRFVIHFNISKSIESYYQESGRAGRDGEKSYCYLFYKPTDISKHDYFIYSNKKVYENRELNRKETFKLNSIYKFCENKFKCRRKIILKYFGENFNESYCKNHCDNCRDKIDYYNIDVYNIIKDFCKNENIGGFNKNMKKNIIKLLDKEIYYNSEICNKNKDEYINKLFNKMINLEIIYEVVTSYNNIPKTFRKIYFDKNNYKKFLNSKKKCTIKISKPSKNKVEFSKELLNIDFGNKEKEKTLSKPKYELLLELLKDKRKEIYLNYNENIDEYTIINYESFFPLRGLQNIAKFLLTNIEDQLNYSGVGRNLIEKHGDKFSKVVSKFIDENNIKVNLEEMNWLKSKKINKPEDIELNNQKYFKSNNKINEKFNDKNFNVKDFIDSFIINKNKEKNFNSLDDIINNLKK